MQIPNLPPWSLSRAFDQFANRVTRSAGSPTAFVASVLVVLLWAVAGPIYRYSEDWQLVINTGTTIVTFLMVFLIQQSQNKDSAALHLKINELILATRQASNHLIAAELLDEEELRALARKYEQLAETLRSGAVAAPASHGGPSRNCDATEADAPSNA